MKTSKFNDAGHQIGFGGMYYTLWQWYWAPKFNPYTSATYYELRIVYIHNLSKDFDEAVEKAKEQTSLPFENTDQLEDKKLTFDKSLRGDKWQVLDYQCEDDHFSFGKLKGLRIAESDDVWQLHRARREENTDLRKKLAAERLVELGELKKYKGQYMTDGEIETAKFNEYQKSLKRGFHETDGARVELKLKCIDAFSFNGYWGRTTVETYVDSEKRMFKYVGSASNADKGDELHIRATIKHTVYKSEHVTADETHLKRIKQIAA